MPKRSTNVLLIASLTAIFGQVYINPFESDFRLSLGVILLGILLLKMQELHVIPTTLITGGVVVLLRTLLGTLQNPGEVINIFLSHIPSISFYFMYGIVLTYAYFKRHNKSLVTVFVSLMLADFMANILETIVRNEFARAEIMTVLMGILGIAVLRAALISVMVISLRLFRNAAQQTEIDAQLSRMVALTSGLQTELFYLKKGSYEMEQMINQLDLALDDIKQASLVDPTLKKMSASLLTLYKDLDAHLNEDLRIADHIEELLPDYIMPVNLPVSRIISMAVERAERKLLHEAKEIEYVVTGHADQSVVHYFELFTILSQLIQNGLEAITYRGVIRITTHQLPNLLKIEVSDNGSGIARENQLKIWDPGFTTRLDKRTGKDKTGMGLATVRQLTEQVFKGDVYIETKTGMGTTVTVELTSEYL